MPVRDVELGLLPDLRTSDFITPTLLADDRPLHRSAAPGGLTSSSPSAQSRPLTPDWSLFAAVSRFLDGLPDEAYDLIIFDCPPAIGYQSMNAVFAADMLYIPSGPGYWEYDSTTSFIGQLAEALEDLGKFRWGCPGGDDRSAERCSTMSASCSPRFEPGNDLHRAMQSAFGRVFRRPDDGTSHRDDTGRRAIGPLPLASIYEIDYRDMTRETWRRARTSFDRAYDEFIGHVAGGTGSLWRTINEQAGRIFDIEFPDGVPAEPPRAGGRRGPMASAIAENAEALAERQSTEIRIREENDRSRARTRPAAQGRPHHRGKFPSARCGTDKLTPRTGPTAATPELDELKASIRSVGLSNPIRVEVGDDGYQLVQGFRRLHAYRELFAETATRPSRGYPPG